MNKSTKFNIGDRVKGVYKHREITGVIETLLIDDPDHDYIISGDNHEGHFYAAESELEPIDIPADPETKKCIVIPVSDDFHNSDCYRCPFYNEAAEFGEYIEPCWKGYDQNNCHIEDTIKEIRL